MAGSLQGVLVVGEGQVQLANAPAAALAGAADAAELHGLPLERLFAADDARRLAAPLGAGRNGAPHRMQATLRTLQGGAVPVEVCALPIPWAGGEALQLALLQRGEPEAMRVELAESRAAFQQIVEGSLQGIYVHVDHRFLFCNQALADMFGYASPEEVLAVGDVLRLYTPPERERLLGYYRARIGGGQPPVRYEFEGLRKDGSTFWLENQVRVVQWRGRQAILATAIDITERKRAEQALQASEERYRNVVESSMQGVLVVRKARPLFVNRAMVQLFGFESAEAFYAIEDITRLIAEEDRQMVVDYSIARMRGIPRPDRYVARYLHRDGHMLWLDSIVRVINWDGAPAIQVAMIDITERKQAEQALQASEERYRNVVESSMQGVLIVRGRRALFANRATAQLFGFDSVEELYALDDLAPFVTEEDRRRMLDYSKARMRGEPAPERYVAQYFHRDGHTIWVDTLVRVVNWGGEPAIQVALIDISDRIRAERELQASEERYRDLVEGSVQGLLIQRGRKALFANPSFARLFGFDSPEQLYAVPDLSALVAEDSREQMRSYARARLHGEAAPTRYIAHGLRRDGTDLWTENLVRVVSWDGAPAIQTSVIDVTQRLRVEHELEEHRRLLETVLDTIPHTVYVKAADMRYRMANRAFCTALGIDPAQVVGARLQDVANMDPAFEEAVDAADRQVMETGRPYEIDDLPIRQRDGRLGRRHVIKYPLRDARGAVVGIVGITENVTERIEAEERLRSSEQLMRIVLDHLPYLMFVKDRNARYQLVNAAFADFHQLSAEQIVGKLVTELPVGSAGDTATFLATDRQVLEHGEAMDTPEVRLTPVGREPRLYHLQKLPLLDDEGNVTGIVGISEDITERKRVEEELRSSRLLLQTVINLLPQWVFVKDPRRRFLMVNRQMAEDYAIGPDVEPGALIDLGTSITEEERSVIYQLDQRVLDTGERVEMPEVQITLPNGGTRLFRTVRMPLRNADGKVAGIVGIAEDITERRRTEQAIQQAQKLESLGVLAGGIAHDFNNLLVSILGNASLAMLDLTQDSPAQAPLAHIETAGQRAAELCRQLLAYSGKGSFEIASVNLNALIQEMTQLLRVSLGRQIHLAYQFDPALPAVEVDATQIRQVVMNLVLNAAEAIGERSGSVTLTTAVVDADREMLSDYIQGDRLPEGRYVCLEVADTGEGIAPEMLGRIFDPFFTTKFTGRGLGLAAVLGIVRGHDGAMQVRSEPGQGSTFRMLLPARAAAGADSPRFAGAADWRGGGVALVVDDEAHVREVLRRMLTSLGFEVLGAADGNEGLARLRERPGAVRVVVLDLTMPGLDGEETLRRLREARPELPALVVSGFAERDVQARFAALGAAAVLQKPFTLPTLAARLRALLE